MINAVLVFNNTGQPRLTKFYSQLVRLSYNLTSNSRTDYVHLGYCGAAEADLRDLRARRRQARLLV